MDRLKVEPLQFRQDEYQVSVNGVLMEGSWNSRGAALAAGPVEWKRHLKREEKARAGLA